MTIFEYALTLPADLIILYANKKDSIAWSVNPALKEACQAIVAMAEELE